MKRVQAMTFLVSAAVSGVVFSNRPADAADRRVSAFGCFTSGGRFEEWQGDNTGVYSTARLNCPLPDDSYMPKWSVRTLTVYGRDGNSSPPPSNYTDPDLDPNIWAVACVTYWGIAGGGCGTGVATNGTFSGNYAVSPGLEVWSQGYPDFAYLWLRLPRGSTTTTQSTFRGFHVST